MDDYFAPHALFADNIHCASRCENVCDPLYNVVQSHNDDFILKDTVGRIVSLVTRGAWLHCKYLHMARPQIHGTAVVCYCGGRGVWTSTLERSGRGVWTSTRPTVANTKRMLAMLEQEGGQVCLDLSITCTGDGRIAQKLCKALQMEELPKALQGVSNIC